MARIRIKICCIASPAEAALAIDAGADAGADALGLVARMPSGPGPISDAEIGEIAGSTPPPLATFLLTSETDPATVVDHVRRCGTNTVQLVDAVAMETYVALRTMCPAVRIVQVLHVTGPETRLEARRLAPHVDALLLDSGNPSAAVRELGGTGRVHDWTVSRRIVEEAGRPVFLAGGLRADNVGAAIAAVRPFGVDLCSGVRTGGALDAAKLAEFVTAVGRATGEWTT